MAPPSAGSGRERTGSGRGIVEQLARRLAHLPVAVSGRRPEGRRHAGIVEAGQRDRRPPSHRGDVGQRTEHGGQAGGVADGAERGHRGLATARVLVPGRRRRQFGYGRPCVPLGQEPGRADHDEGISIVQRAGDGAG
jgi:hypothetical protein